MSVCSWMALQHEVHAHAGADGGDVIGAQQRQITVFAAYRSTSWRVMMYLGVIGADVIGHFAGVFQIDGILVHADGESADGLLPQHLGADGAHQRGIQAAGEQEAQRGIGVQPLIHTGDQLIADGAADGLQIIMAILRNSGQCRRSGRTCRLRSNAPAGRGRPRLHRPTRFLASLANTMPPSSR